MVVVSIVQVKPTQSEVCFMVDLYPLWLPPFPDVSAAANISGVQNMTENTLVVGEILALEVKGTQENDILHYLIPGFVPVAAA